MKNKLTDLAKIFSWQLLILIFILFNGEFADVLTKTFRDFGLNPSSQPFGMVMNTIIFMTIIFVIIGFVILSQLKERLSKNLFVILHIQYIVFWLGLFHFNL